MFVTAHEGRCLKVYADAAGNPTIGVGHLLKSFDQFPMGITEEECERLLRVDLARCEHTINELSQRHTLAQHQFDALVDFCFNVGSPRFRHSQIGIELHKGRIDRLPIYFFFWTKAGGRRLKALLARRHACARLFWFSEYQPGY